MHARERTDFHDEPLELSTPYRAYVQDADSLAGRLIHSRGDLSPCSNKKAQRACPSVQP